MFNRRISMNALKLTLISVATGLIATSAQALTFNTTGWLANSKLTFGADAVNTAIAAGVILSPAGNATRLPDEMGADFNGNMVPVPVYSFPVTESQAKIGWNLKIIATKGITVGSGVKMVRYDDPVTSAGLANFDVDFEADIMYADVYTPQGTTKMPLYKFTDDNNTVTKISGFQIISKGTVSKLTFTPTAVEAIATALELSDVLKATLVTSDWGKVTIDVTSKSRKPKTNGAVLTREAMGIPLL
jgi:hypothetical protein